MSKFATKEDAGKSSGEQNRGVTGEAKPRILRRTAEGRCATWTDSLEFGSSNERNVSSEEEEEEEEGRYQSPTAEMGSGSGSWRSKMRRKSTWLDMSNFPSLLSTLNENGRPGFDFIKTRDNGRLKMTMVPSERPEVVALQTPPMRMDKCLKMLLIRTDDDHEDPRHYDQITTGKKRKDYNPVLAMVAASDDQES